jgi:hypothetical protein
MTAPGPNGQETGILSQYVATRKGTGQIKVEGAKVNGVLPANGQYAYVCQQLMAAKNYARWLGNASPAEVKSNYPYTSNRGPNKDGTYDIPRGATNVTAFGRTRVFVDAGVNWPF